MNLLDWIILLAAVVYGFTGFRNGAVVGALSLVGFFSGAIVGAQLAEPLGSWLADGRAQVPIAVVCVLFTAMIGQMLGVFVGHRVRTRFIRNAGRHVDAAVGVALGVVSVLLVAWMVAVPLASSPYPSLASEASESSIVRGVDGVMPDGMRSLYGKLRGYLDQSGFPPVFGDLPSNSIVDVAPPPASLGPAARRHLRVSERSVVKVYGTADSCDRHTEGSGFVISRDHVMTNAHVVAGTSAQSVVDRNGNTISDQARVVYYDPDVDVAVLYVPGLNADPLHFVHHPAGEGDPAIVLGYPEDGPLTPDLARVRSRGTIGGADIYGNGGVAREVYSVRATVRSGNSGGPLLTPRGRVLGVVFATDLRSSDTGYVLTAAEVAGAYQRARDATAQKGTGGCTPG
jgi:S1-C subfamily serine protease